MNGLSPVLINTLDLAFWGDWGREIVANGL